MKSPKIHKLFIFFLFFFLFIIIFVYALQTMTVGIGDVTAFSNSSNVSMQVSLANNNSITGFQMIINHTPYLVFHTVEPTIRMQDAVIETNDANGQLHIAALAPNNITLGTGTIFTLLFDVAENAEAGEYLLLAEDILLTDIDVQSYPSVSLEGIFTILVDSDNDGIDDSIDACQLTAGCLQFQGCAFGLKDWQPPISNETIFNMEQGVTLPLKFSVTNCTDDFFIDNNITVQIYNLTLGINKTYNASGTGDDYVRINESENKYITNIHSNALNMSLGNYTISVAVSNGLTNNIGFELIQNGKGKGKKVS